MPYLKIQTNQDVADKSGVLKKLSALAAEALGKPESYIQTAFDARTEMTFGGTDAPTAFVICKSLGLTDARTGALSGAICAFCESELSIPKDRVYIEFAGPPGSMWGWKGRTF